MMPNAWVSIKKKPSPTLIWTANSLAGVRIRTLIAGTRFERNNSLSSVGNTYAAVCIRVNNQSQLNICRILNLESPITIKKAMKFSNNSASLKQ